jgi:hypothetical protein
VIQQLADRDEPFDLVIWIEAFALVVARGRGEAVSPFPDSQRVLRNAGVTIDIADGMQPVFDLCCGHRKIRSLCTTENNPFVFRRTISRDSPGVSR